jgi:hypothetical protein
MRAIRVAFVLLAVLGVACGGGQKTGSEKVLDFEEQKKADQLGAATPKPTAKAAGATSAPTRTAAPATAKPVAETFDVQLIAGNPYYAPGDDLRMPAGATLRVTNKDTTPERSKGRSFTAENGAFDSGLIRPGAMWTHVIAQKGTYTIVDTALNFARATLTVY